MNTSFWFYFGRKRVELNEGNIEDFLQHLEKSAMPQAYWDRAVDKNHESASDKLKIVDNLIRQIGDFRVSIFAQGSKLAQSSREGVDRTTQMERCFEGSL